MDTAKSVPNRLIREKSPYLLQHAENPVDWFPWGEEAFIKAREEDKPVFLSIGYSTCHWCHVMAHESFEDPHIAGLLNKHYVPIKVDREERPDIDAVYMEACQAMTGQGGWPLTIIMTPEQRPFFAATYLPKHHRYGVTGMAELLPEISKQWDQNRERLLEAGDRVQAYLDDLAKQKVQPQEPSRKLLISALSQFRKSFDEENGGFGGAPKFPSPQNLLFLLRYSAMDNQPDALAMAEKTLIQMYRGGIFDHIGGGFSRYATDPAWLVPHFEKMLYDNAMLSYAYLEAYRLTKKESYRMIAEQTFSYVLRELTDEQGGFYCGQDADSEGEEGKYYLFTPQEVKQVLGEEQGELFCRQYQITEQGNFEGKNIPNLLHGQKLRQEFQEEKEKLLQYRVTRCRLHKDDKVLTAWNGLMIAAFAKAYAVLGEIRFLQAASSAHQFLQGHLIQDRKLLARWRDGEAAIAGHLEDYAFYSWGLLELYEASCDLAYLQDAERIAHNMIDQFWDSSNGGFYHTASHDAALIARLKEQYDGAMPSGNSAAALVLQRLASYTGKPEWAEYSYRQFQYLTGGIKAYPAGHSFSLCALLEALYPTQELLCASYQKIDVRQIHSVVNESQYPVYTVIKTPATEKTLSDIIPFTRDYPIPDQGIAFYVCQNGVCNRPVTSWEALKHMLIQ